MCIDTLVRCLDCVRKGLSWTERSTLCDRFVDCYVTLGSLQADDNECLSRYHLHLYSTTRLLFFGRFTLLCRAVSSSVNKLPRELIALNSPLAETNRVKHFFKAHQRSPTKEQRTRYFNTDKVFSRPLTPSKSPKHRSRYWTNCALRGNPSSAQWVNVRSLKRNHDLRRRGYCLAGFRLILHPQQRDTFSGRLACSLTDTAADWNSSRLLFFLTSNCRLNASEW